MKHIEVSRVTNFEGLKVKSLSARNQNNIKIFNTNYKTLREIVGDNIIGGKEVGSKAYINKSPYYFIRTKACQPENYLLDLKDGGVKPVSPHYFTYQDIREGDIFVLKDSNVGEVVYIDQDLDNFMMSGGIRKLRIKSDSLYIFAFLKSIFFKDQLEILIGKGATIKHAQDKYLDCIVVFPSNNEEKVKEYVKTLVEAVIRKEKEIKIKDSEIIKTFDNELLSSSNTEINYRLTFNELLSSQRFDAGYLSGDFKNQVNIIKNYKNGAKTIYELGFTIERGQNLQISAIGNSIYSEEYKPNYYKLYLPTYITEVGTMSNIIYLGNPNELKCLEYGDLVIGGEGFDKGRSIVITEQISNTITNIHGIILKNKDKNLYESIYLKCFLHYIRSKGMIDNFGAGGNGGSLGIKYWDNIYVPIFGNEIKNKLISLYYNNINFDSISSIGEFKEKDNLITQKSGILDLDRQIKILKKRINEVIGQIYHNYDIKLDFEFLNSN